MDKRSNKDKLKNLSSVGSEVVVDVYFVGLKISGRGEYTVSPYVNGYGIVQT